MFETSFYFLWSYWFYVSYQAAGPAVTKVKTQKAGLTKNKLLPLQIQLKFVTVRLYAKLG